MLSKKGEDNFDQKVRRFVCGIPQVEFQVVRQFLQGFEGRLGEAFTVLPRVEGIRVHPGLSQFVPFGFGFQVLQGVSVNGFGDTSELRVDFNAVQIAHDQQRGVFQVVFITQQLNVSVPQVRCVFIFVLPTKTALLPDIRKALFACRFFDMLLETVMRVPRGVRFQRGGHPQQSAKVIEVLSVRCALFGCDFRPFFDEFTGRHCIKA
ncbi:hypothetical protein [Deinococcus misasensis]|uniref:hypothetical protein n=1 Tax=Deinococcus misasensis TaxID=392413 RepID=UPI0012F90E89|nr:hypothetical protein [Deinococcus misasensis]